MRLSSSRTAFSHPAAWMLATLPISDARRSWALKAGNCVAGSPLLESRPISPTPAAGSDASSSLSLASARSDHASECQGWTP